MNPAVSTTGTGEAEYTTSRQDVGKANGTATCSRIEIRPSKNGGFSVECFYAQQNDAKGASAPYKDPDTYAFSTFDELVSYLRTELGAPADAPPAAGSDVDVDTAGATAPA